MKHCHFSSSEKYKMFIRYIRSFIDPFSVPPVAVAYSSVIRLINIIEVKNTLS